MLSDIATLTISRAITAGPLEERKAGLVLLGMRTLSEVLGHVVHEAPNIISAHIPIARPKIAFLIQLESSCSIVSHVFGKQR